MLRFDFELRGRRAAVREMDKILPLFSTELRRSYFRGVVADSGWPDGDRSKFPYSTGASRRGFSVESSERGLDFQITNREDYAKYVEAGVNRRDGGRFIARWIEAHGESTARAALDYAAQQAK